MQNLVSRIRWDWRVFPMSAFLLLAIPIRWLSAILLAAVFHEMGHIAALRLCGGEIRSICVGVNGVRIEAEGLPRRQELICILAGPACSFLLLLSAHCFPRLAICGFVQGAYNLLPFPFLDGGGVLRCLRGDEEKIPCKRREQRVQ